MVSLNYQIGRREGYLDCYNNVFKVDDWASVVDPQYVFGYRDGWTKASLERLQGANVQQSTETKTGEK